MSKRVTSRDYPLILNTKVFDDHLYVNIEMHVMVSDPKYLEFQSSTWVRLK